MNSWNAINDMLEEHDISFNCPMLDCRSQEFYIAKPEEFGTRSTAKTYPVLAWQTPLRERPLVDEIVMHHNLRGCLFVHVRGDRYEDDAVLVFDERKSTNDLLQRLKKR